jgi:hypothetical protein
MGQYYKIANVDQQQFIVPYQFGDGLKLMEFGCSGQGTLTALAYLLAQRSEQGSGCWERGTAFGSWVGNRIVVAGDYADEGRFCPPGVEGPLYSLCCAQDEDADSPKSARLAEVSDIVITGLAQVAPGLALCKLVKDEGGWPFVAQEVSRVHQLRTKAAMRKHVIPSLSYLAEFCYETMPALPSISGFQQVLAGIANRVASLDRNHRDATFSVTDLVLASTADNKQIASISFKLQANSKNKPISTTLAFPCTFDDIANLVGSSFPPLRDFIRSLSED